MISFEEKVVVEPEFIRFETRGKYAFEELFGFLGRVREVAEEAYQRKILIDSRLLEGNMTEGERFEGGKKIAEVFGSRFRVALVMPPKTITKLGELAAVNRGADFLVSPVLDEAITWLLRK